MITYSELEACVPIPVNEDRFNRTAILPHGLKVEHVHASMVAFLDFLGFVNAQLNTKQISRLEAMLMPANFSSIVGEFMSTTIPKYCPSLVKNRYHNGHPDLIPASMFLNDSAQYAEQGIEIKASRYFRGWQGHNPEAAWLMVFVFDGNRPKDTIPRPFCFRLVAGAQLSKEDWYFSGRSETSRRTITASVAESGYQKMMSNWIYNASEI